MANSNLPTSAAAAVFRAINSPLSIERFQIPTLPAGAALAKIRCATICGSDLHSYYGRRPSPLPGILGHEMVADIAAVGAGGATDYRGHSLQLGDRVTWSMVWSCGRCFYCRRHLRPKCERLMKFGHQQLTSEWTLSGGLAEYCYLPAKTAIFKIPRNVPDAIASSANCATATVAALFRTAKSVSDQNVVIHGAGMLGQMACAMAAFGGARRIIVLEPSRLRRELALRFGATDALDNSLPFEQITENVLNLTGGHGADLAFELAGFPEAVELGVRLLRPGGSFLLAGSTFPSRPASIDAEQLVRRLLQITGVYNYDPEDLEAALQFLSATQGRFPFESLVSKTFQLADVNAAFSFAERERPARVAVIP